MKKPTQHFIAEVPRRAPGRMTIGIDLGDVWSHYCTLNEDEKWLTGDGFVPVHRESRSGLPIASSTDRDGSGHALDLDQRAA